MQIDEQYVICDIETNGFYHQTTKIHCLSLVDFCNKEFLYTENNIENGLEHIQEYKTVVFHNGVNFDIPTIQKLHPWFSCQIFDTMLASRLIWTNLSEIDEERNNGLKGSHSLEAWGKRIGILKGDYGKTSSWEKYTEEMGEYCIQDSRVTKHLFDLIRSKDFSMEAMEIEHLFAEIISRQEKSGFYFDLKKADKLKRVLSQRQKELDVELEKIFPPTLEEMKTPAYWIGTVNGIKQRFSNKSKALKAKAIDIERGPNKVKEIPFNPNSRKQVAEALITRYGWVPKVFTETGQPSIDDDVLSSLEYPEAQALAELMMIKKRLGQLETGDNAWLKLVSNNKIHGSVITNGAVTGRCTHHSPNMAQIPSVDSPYGHECRELFKTPNGYKLVGVDAAGLEARCKAHYMYYWDGGEFVKIILEGDKDKGTDIHSLNASSLGLSRNEAKTWYYAFMYGSGNDKLGKIAGKDGEYGKQMKEMFFKRFPALKALIEAVTTQAESRGYLYGLDGRKLFIRSSHKCLNTLLQSAGAVVMKKALIILENKLKLSGYIYNVDYFYCANVHDEFQIAVKDSNNLPEIIGKLAVQAIVESGKHFNFNCPLDGEYKIGNNWAETH